MVDSCTLKPSRSFASLSQLQKISCISYEPLGFNHAVKKEFCFPGRGVAWKIVVGDVLEQIAMPFFKAYQFCDDERGCSTRWTGSRCRYRRRYGCSICPIYECIRCHKNHEGRAALMWSSVVRLIYIHIYIRYFN